MINSPLFLSKFFHTLYPSRVLSTYQLESCRPAHAPKAQDAIASFFSKICCKSLRAFFQCGDTENYVQHLCDTMREAAAIAKVAVLVVAPVVADVVTTAATTYSTIAV